LLLGPFSYVLPPWLKPLVTPLFVAVWYVRAKVRRLRGKKLKLLQQLYNIYFLTLTWHCSCN